MNLTLGNRSGTTTIGSYELLEIIGEGGMADVYLGIKKSVSNIRTFYAVKVIKPTHAMDERFSRMFLDEARIMSSIRHPNLLTLHEILAHNGQYLIVMEYLKGQDGRRLVGRSSNRTPLPIDVAVNIVHQACIGLHHAHEARNIEGEPLQLVHRDVSPHNLFITFDGYTKVLDFGIAKSEMQVEETKSGFLKGKVPYLSPEQCASEGPIDHRTDVYSLGVVLYEFLTGKRPCSGRNEIQVLQSILYSDPAPPSYYRPELPEELSAIMLKALAKKPSERFATCAEFRDALSSLGATHGWKLTERSLAAYMRDEHGDYKALLEKKLVSLLTNSVSTSDEQLDIPYEDRSVQRLVLGSDCLGAMRKYGEFTGYKLSGQLRESFDYGPLIDSSSKVMVLDLASLSRVTSFGIRQWLSLIPELRQRHKRVILNRVSVPLNNQMVTIPAMIEGVEVASIKVPFYCTSCAHQFDLVVRAGEAIPMDANCVRCHAGDAKFDEDDIYLSPLRDSVEPQGGLLLFIEELEALDEATSESPVEKHITSERTEILLRGEVPASTRWDRLIAGMEGELRVEFAPGASIDRTTWRHFEAALNQIQEEVDLSIWGFPAEGPEEFEELHGSSPYFQSLTFASACPRCERVEHRDWRLGDSEATTICRQCSEPLSRSYQSDGDQNPTSREEPDEPSVVTRTETVTNTQVSSGQKNFLASWIFTAIVVVLIVGIIVAILR